MKSIIRLKVVAICFTILGTFDSLGQNINKAKINNIQKTYLAPLYKFRKTIYTDKYNEVFAMDSLKDNISTLIAISNKSQDPSQLKIIAEYFNVANSAIDSDKLSKEQLDYISQNINKDLNYKLTTFENPTFNLEGGLKFGQKKHVKVTAFIDGEVKNSGHYRLYWTFYTGRPFTQLIANKNYSSNKFSNPFTIEIIVPGYITFWLEDTSSGTVYKPDIDYKKFDFNISDTNIDIDFKKL